MGRKWQRFFPVVSYILLTCIASNAQHAPPGMGNTGSGVNLNDHMLILDSRKSLNNDGSPIEGSPYYTEEFVIGDVYTSKGVIRNVQLRYDIFNDFMEFKKENIVYILETGPDISQIKLGTETFVASYFPEKGRLVPHHFIVLDSGTISLLRKPNVAYRSAQAPKALEAGGKPARFERMQDKYYTTNSKKRLTEIVSLKRVADIFPDHQEEIHTFIKNEKISKNEPDLIRLFQYYNSLN